MGQIIDGKRLAERLRAEIAQNVARHFELYGTRVGLAVVIVGEDPASQIYVRNKIKACEEVGIRSFHHVLPAAVEPPVLLELIQTLNLDSQVHGILVQLPLPPALRSLDVIQAIHPDKDVDGLHPLNAGRLLTGRRGFVPCTPQGVMKMFDDLGLSLSGKRAVVLGRSAIVGKPLGLLMLARDATVTFCHSHTVNLSERVAEADVLVAAVGVPELVKASWIKPGAVVIDVGVNRVAGRVVGDVEFAPILDRASYVTPVPGGVGPMTIAMLLSNTLEAARLSRGEIS